jgi:hypothetical protein
MSFCSAKIPILQFFRGKSESSTPPPPTTTTKSFIEPRIYDLAVKKGLKHTELIIYKLEYFGIFWNMLEYVGLC